MPVGDGPAPSPLRALPAHRRPARSCWPRSASTTGGRARACTTATAPGPASSTSSSAPTRASASTAWASARTAGSTTRAWRSTSCSATPRCRSRSCSQPRLRLPVEQPGRRPRRVRRERHALDRLPGARDRLLRDHRPPAEILARYADATGHAPRLPHVGERLLAVQAALSHPGGTARGRARAPPARTAAVGDRRRLLPLDGDGRLPVRPRRVPGPRGDDARARRAGRAPHGLDLADGLAAVGELRGAARRGDARRLATRASSSTSRSATRAWTCRCPSRSTTPPTRARASTSGR